MYKQKFAVDILVCYKHVYQHSTQVIVDSLRCNCWLQKLFAILDSNNLNSCDLIDSLCTCC